MILKNIDNLLEQIEQKEKPKKSFIKGALGVLGASAVRVGLRHIAKDALHDSQREDIQNKLHQIAIKYDPMIR